MDRSISVVRIRNQIRSDPKTAIIMAEILGPPMGLRPPEGSEA